MKKLLNRKNFFVVSVILLFLFLSYFLLQESLEKTLFLSFTLFLWLSTYLYTKDLTFSSFLYILIVLPFNLTLQLQGNVEIFNTYFNFPSPFVNGIYSNYLVPTLSIVDIGAVLFLFSILVEKGFKYLWSIIKDFKNGFLLFLFFLLIQNIFLSSAFTVLTSTRLVLYLLVLFSLIDYCKENSSEKVLLTSSFVLLLNLIIQGAVGILQVFKGASLGLLFLGESQVVNGMQGSSFVDLGGKLLLRAYGTFPHPNILGGFLVLCILFGILSSKKIPGVGIPLVILSLIILPFTFSRIAIVLSVLILFLLLLRSTLNLKTKQFSFSPLLLLERFRNLLSGKDSGWGDRVNLLKASWRVLKGNYVFGTGSGSFVKGMENFVPTTSGGISLVQPVHNIFVLLLVELGVFGFPIYLYILLRLLVKNVGKVTVFKVMVVTAILGLGFWDHFLVSLPQGSIFLILMFLLLLFDSEDLKKKGKEKLSL